MPLKSAFINLLLKILWEKETKIFCTKNRGKVFKVCHPDSRHSPQLPPMIIRCVGLFTNEVEPFYQSASL